MCNNNRIHAEAVQTAFEPLGKPTPAMLVQDVANAYFPSAPPKNAIAILRKEIGKYALHDKMMLQILQKSTYSRWFEPKHVNHLIKILGMPRRGFKNV